MTDHHHLFISSSLSSSLKESKIFLNVWNSIGGGGKMYGKSFNSFTPDSNLSVNVSECRLFIGFSGFAFDIFVVLFLAETLSFLKSSSLEYSILLTRSCNL